MFPILFLIFCVNALTIVFYYNLYSDLSKISFNVFLHIHIKENLIGNNDVIFNSEFYHVYIVCVYV